MFKVMQLNKRHVRRRNIKTVSRKISEGKSLLVMFSFLVVGLTCVAYIIQTNSVATQGYEVEKYERRLKELKQEYKSMKVVEAEYRSIKHLADKKEALQTVTSNDIAFLKPTDINVAMR